MYRFIIKVIKEKVIKKAQGFFLFILQVVKSEVKA